MRYALASTQKPSGMGKPAYPRRARFAALGPNRSASAASADVDGTMSECIDILQVDLGLSIGGIPGHRADHGDLLDRESGDDLDAILVHDQHLLDAHAPLMRLAVLRLERKHHPFLDLDGMVERPDARDHRRIVLCEAQSVAPQISRRLVFFLITPRFLCRRSFQRDLPRGGADLYRLDRIVEPLERGGVIVFLLLCGLLADAIGAVVAGFVAVPGERR